MLVLAAGGVYVVAMPMWDDVKAATIEVQTLDALIERRETLNAIGADVIKRYQAVSQADLRRIDMLVPDSIDNVKLILELQRMAEQFNLNVERIDVAGEGSRDLAGRRLNTVSFQANLSGSYSDFIIFLEQLEKNQRIIDLRSLSFQSNNTEDAEYIYNLTLDTYWMES